jgi:hypothetical protein
LKARLSVPGDSSPPGRFATDLGVAWDLGPSQAVRHPREKTRTWKQVIKAHWDSLYACDFFSVETLGLGGTVRYMIFFVIELKTRAVEIAGIRVDPDGEWMKQMTRNLSDGVDGFLRQAKYLIHDRDPLFTEAFEAILRERGVKCVKIPAQSPNCSPHAERFVKTIRHECTYPAGSRAGCHPYQRAAAV